MTHDISRLQPRHQPHSVEDGGDVERPLVLIVDDDEAVRTALRELFLSVGLDATCFASTRELLDAELPQRPGCLILDVRMPGSGHRFLVVTEREVRLCDEVEAVPRGEAGRGASPVQAAGTPRPICRHSGALGRAASDLPQDWDRSRPRARSRRSPRRAAAARSLWRRGRSALGAASGRARPRARQIAPSGATYPGHGSSG